MRVLHYSDKGSKEFLDLYKMSNILIATGDLRFTDFFNLEEYEPKIPAFGVYGNHDDGCTYLEKNRIINVHNKVVEFEGLKFGGFQGCLRYNSRQMQYTEYEAEVFYETFPRVDVLILHAGPLGLLDDPSDSVHQGSRFIRRYVEEKEPKYVFCGHQYSDESMLFNSTQLYRTYGARILDLPLI
jgi:uncharacterized protein